MQSNDPKSQKRCLARRLSSGIVVPISGGAISATLIKLLSARVRE